MTAPNKKDENAIAEEILRDIDLAENAGKFS